MQFPPISTMAPKDLKHVPFNRRLRGMADARSEADAETAREQVEAMRRQAAEMPVESADAALEYEEEGRPSQQEQQQEQQQQQEEESEVVDGKLGDELEQLAIEREEEGEKSPTELKDLLLKLGEDTDPTSLRAAAERHWCDLREGRLQEYCHRYEEALLKEEADNSKSDDEVDSSAAETTITADTAGEAFAKLPAFGKEESVDSGVSSTRETPSPAALHQAAASTIVATDATATASAAAATEATPATATTLAAAATEAPPTTATTLAAAATEAPPTTATTLAAAATEATPATATTSSAAATAAGGSVSSVASSGDSEVCYTEGQESSSGTTTNSSPSPVPSSSATEDLVSFS